MAIYEVVQPRFIGLLETKCAHPSCNNRKVDGHKYCFDCCSERYL